MQTSKFSPEDIVSENVGFYNQRDIDAFMSSFSADISLYNFGEAQATLSGPEEIRGFYKDLFDNSPQLHSTIMKRIVIGNRVIDHESIVGRNGSTHPVELVLIYQVASDKIESITVLRP